MGCWVMRELEWVWKGRGVALVDMIWRSGFYSREARAVQGKEKSHELRAVGHHMRRAVHDGWER